MGVPKKTFRKIVVNGREFYWHVFDRCPEYFLRVMSDDRHFLVVYDLFDFDPYCNLTVGGREFPGLPEAGQGDSVFHCPQFVDNARAVTPGMVRRLIEWCFYSERELIRVNNHGRPVPPLTSAGEELRARQERHSADFRERWEKLKPLYPRWCDLLLERASALLAAGSPGGRVRLEMDVDKTGRVDRVEVKDGPDHLREAVLGALEGMVFEPYALRGVPEDASCIMNLDFQPKA